MKFCTLLQGFFHSDERKIFHILICYFKTNIRGQLETTSCKLRVAANNVRYPCAKETKMVFLKQNPIDPPLSHVSVLIEGRGDWG